MAISFIPKFIVPNGHNLAPSLSQEYFLLEKRKIPERGYFGLFAGEFIPKGCVIVQAGGVVLSDLSDLPPSLDYGMAIDDKHYLAPRDFGNIDNFFFINHSCNSNIARIGPLTLVSKIDIHAGEELTSDYSPLIGNDHLWKMTCLCQSSNCRKLISATDWQNPELASKLWREWLPFMQKKILKFHDGKVDTSRAW